MAGSTKSDWARFLAALLACPLANAGGTLDADFCIVQFPTSFPVSAGQLSPLIYGRIFEDDNGIPTADPGPHPSISAQLGYGAFGSDPRGPNPDWTWIGAAFNVQVGNDDEYQAAFVAPMTSTTTQHSYAYRFSLDGGQNHTYCDLDGNGSNPGLSFSTSSLGLMTVTPAGSIFVHGFED